MTLNDRQRRPQIMGNRRDHVASLLLQLPLPLQGLLQRDPHLFEGIGELDQLLRPTCSCDGEIQVILLDSSSSPDDPCDRRFEPFTQFSRENKREQDDEEERCDQTAQNKHNEQPVSRVVGGYT
ncbi:hypothetical protein D3C76_982260 [compost metagenome]